ncbi:hypothetical protein ACROYT_G036903 [Oculina patagonica]
MRRGRRSNILNALIRRETGLRRTNDQDLLLSYAEDSSVTSCHRSKECELPGSPRSTFLVTFSPDKTKMASSHGDHTVRIVDCKTLKCVNTLRGHPRTPWCITFHPSSDQLLASGCLGGQVRVWNLKTGDSEVYTPPDKAVIASLAFHPTDHVLLIATSNKLLFWSWDQPEPFACIQTASVEEKVRLVAFSPLGDHILTAVTNIVSQTAANPGTFARSRSSVVNRLLQSIGNSRTDAGDQFAAYVLRPSTASSSSTSSSSASTTSAPVPETTSTTSLNSPGSTVDLNSEPITRGNEASSSPVRNQSDVNQADVTDGNQDYRGVFAIFRARDNNTWNFDVTSDGTDSNLLEQGSNENSVTFESDSSNEGSGVSLSLSTGDTDVYSEVGDAATNPESMEPSVPFSSQYFSSDAVPPSDEATDRVVGVGRVINVGPSSSRTSYLSHGSNHSSSFATLGGSQGTGTAVATATARTFRHVHTAVVVADGTNGGPQFALRSAINRAIAGAFAGCGEGAVASNIINTTHRLQWWDFSQVKLPDLKDSESHVIAPSCKIHNDASCDISSDGKLLATFVPSAQGFPDDGTVAVYSLEKSALGQCVFSKKFGPNAISISLSPRNRYIMMVAQIFRLTDKDSQSDTVKPVVTIMHECEADRRSHVSVNAAFFHPLVGNGLVYGTNRGHLHMRQFGQRSTSRYSNLTS